MGKQRSISDYQQDDRNANKGTVRGMAALEDSLRKNGAGRSILVDKDGRIIAGNKTHEQAAAIGLQKVIEVETDGTALVVVRRTDLDIDSPEARRLAIADNRVGELDLAWDASVLAELAGETPGLLNGLFDQDELEKLLEAAGDVLLTPDFEPVGMDEQGRLDEKKKVQCPECGHEFAP